MESLKAFPKSAIRRPHDMTRKEMLQLPRIVGRLDLEDASALLNVQPYEASVLVRLGILRPLGSPKQNSRRWFAAVDILALASDAKALDRCTRAIARHIADKSSRQRSRKGVTEVDFVDGERTENV